MHSPFPEFRLISRFGNVPETRQLFLFSPLFRSIRFCVALLLTLLSHSLFVNPPPLPPFHEYRIEHQIDLLKSPQNNNNATTCELCVCVCSARNMSSRRLIRDNLQKSSIERKEIRSETRGLIPTDANLPPALVKIPIIFRHNSLHD